jgi:hypothetical protein
MEVKEMKCFIVNSKDLFDLKKNPHLSLSVRDIEKNPKIPKKRLPVRRGEVPFSEFPGRET